MWIMKSKWLCIALAFLLGVLLGIVIAKPSDFVTSLLPGAASRSVPKDRYVAVFMTGGELFYGRIEGLGNPFPVLSNVFYIQSHQDPNTKEISNTLVKRGSEGHGPDRTFLNASQIIFIEPVGKGSRVANLIAQASQ